MVLSTPLNKNLKNKKFFFKNVPQYRFTLNRIKDSIEDCVLIREYTGKKAPISWYILRMSISGVCNLIVT